MAIWFMVRYTYSAPVEHTQTNISQFEFDIFVMCDRQLKHNIEDNHTHIAFAVIGNLWPKLSAEWQLPRVYVYPFCVVHAMYHVQYVH